MPNSTSTASTTSHAAATMDDMADRAARRADGSIEATRRVANQALDSLQSGVDQIRTAVPGAFARAAAQVEEITRRGVDRARSAGQTAREQALRAGDATVMRIRDEPVKAVLAAAAAGAAIAALVSWAMRSRSQRY